ncbi:MAG: aconitate hydratase [Deltaproteobacteria bacterium]
MKKTLTEKIIGSHLFEGRSGGDIDDLALVIDQTLTQDATGTMAYLQFESMCVEKVRTQLSVSYIDHNTTQIGFENADDHRYLQSVALKYGIYFSRAGNGICHQVHLERFGIPGKTLIGSDSHTPTAGALGMFAIGAGGLDVAMAMAGKPFYLHRPKIIKIDMSGKLCKWVSAKDVILKILKILTTKGNSDCILEYTGIGVASLTIPERATIANMGAECGVITSIFPSDEATRLFLLSQGRESDWVDLRADDGAEYDRVIHINLSEIEPMVAKPHSPDNVVSIRSIGNINVDQVCIGSCTNSSYKDLAIVAKMLEGKVVHCGVDFAIAPGSRQVLLNLERDGYLGMLLSSGARIMENACGFCIGNSFSPPSAGISFRTSNRNFLARSGTKDAEVYIVSPQSAASAVLTGCACDPRDMGIEYPQIKEPDVFYTNDAMIIPPISEEKRQNIKIVRGPNIGLLPKSEILSQNINGIVTIKVGDKITTDHIIPAGDKMKYRSNIPKYSEFVFSNMDNEFSKRAIKNKDNGTHNIIIAGHSYGQGSSREHAAICPMFLGVKVIIAKSFERIHIANLINFGIVPLLFAVDSDYDQIEQGDELIISNINDTIAKLDKEITAINTTKSTSIKLKMDFNQRQKTALLNGGLLNIIR